jgi:glyoxylase-like metal-dependent hydrolase (beta-lactamase superfamily II)
MEDRSREDLLRINSILSLPFAENTYIAWFHGRTDCLVVDPGLEPDKILEFLASEGLAPAAILNTHGHADHIAGNGTLKERWPDCPLAIGAGDAPALLDPKLNLSAGFGLELTSPPADTLLREGDIYRAAGFELEVFDVPGHSPGHVVFVWRGGRPWRVFGGDVLFAGSVGRTDLPGGSFATLRTGIQTKLFCLPDDTIVLPGHGEPTTTGEERRTNPYVGTAAGQRPGGG